MDPFTQKLLQRTQARKEQLAKKREELAAYRAAKNPTNHDNRERRPLSEENKDHKENAAETIKKPKIDSDAKDVQRDRVKNAPEIDANSPSIKARKERLIQMQQKAKENAPAPKKHWKQLDLGGAGGKDKNSSPSVAARSAAFQTKVADQNKAHANVQEAALPITPKKLSETRNIFEKGAQPLATADTEKMSCTAPPKPPRLAEGKPKAEEKRRKAPSPPTSDASDASNKSVEPQVTKRKAPSPPSEVEQAASDKMEAVESSTESSGSEGPVLKKEKKTKTSVNEDQDSELKPSKSRGGGLGNTTVVICKNDCSEQAPIPKPRKRMQVPENSTIAVTNLEEEKCNVEGDGPARKAKRSSVIVATAQLVDDGPNHKVEKAPGKAGNETVVIEACVVESNESQNDRRLATTVKAMPLEDDSRPAPIRAKVKPVEPQQNQTTTRKGGEGGVSTATKRTSSRVGKADNQNKWDRQPFKVPEKRGRPQQHTAPENQWDDCPADLDETINLNDVNIHEITFNFDFSKFDEEFSDDKEQFKMSYEERCKKLEQKKLTSPTAQEPRAVPCEFTVEEKGVHASGYNSISSEQYAAKVKSPNRCPSEPEKQQTLQDKIKTLLEKAAFQQNIVLQASRAVNVCAATNDVRFGEEGEVEAERVLLLATERRQSCLDEVQRLKTNQSDARPESHEGSMPCKATVYLEGIQLPLKREFMDSLRNGIRSDMGIYYFVCIVEQGPDQVFCSRVRSTTNATEEAMLKFCDKFVLENVKPNFAVTLKIFAMNVQRIPAALPSTPKQKMFQSPKVIKNKLSVKRGTDIAASPKTVFRTSSFSLVGVTHVTLPLVHSKKLTLDKVPEGYPLNNYMQVKMQCIPTYTSSVKGFLTILEDVGGYGAWQRRWCALESGLLQYWRYPGDETAKAPLGCLDLSHCISNSVTTVSRDLCARPNTMELKVKRNQEGTSTEVRYLLAADTKQDRSTWLDSLNVALMDYRAWNPEPVYPQLGHMFNQDVYMCSNKSPTS